MNNKLTSDRIYALKALAIIGVIPAHIPSAPTSYSFLCQVVSLLLGNVGSMGVGIFFFISGYLLASGTSKNLSFSFFLKRKIEFVVIPWFVASTLVYIYVALRKGGNILQYIARLFGYMSTFWYMSVIFFLFITYFFILRSDKWILLSYIGFILSAFSIILRMCGIIPQNTFGVYLNPFNWTIFFSSGIIFSKFEETILTYINKVRFLLALIFIIILLSAFWGFRLGYFDYYYIPVELLVIATSLCMGNLERYSVIKYIGKNSFSIYLYHILPWAGLISHYLLKYDNCMLLLLIPALVLLCTILMLYLGYLIAEKIGFGTLYCKLSGYHGS